VRDLWIKQKWSVLSAVVLSILTLTVFGFSRDQGPESSVRRYLAALGSQEMVQALSHVATNPPGKNEQELANLSLNLLARSRQVQLARVQQSGRTATVDVIFRGPNIGIVPFQYVVVKPGLRWKIDAGQTMDLRRIPVL
jgi:hypothetical protein